MLRKIKIAVILLCCIVAFVLSGCSKVGSEKSHDSSCQIYLDNLPKEYHMLSTEVRSIIEINVSLRNTSSDKKYHVILSDENNYHQTLELMPGTYEVYSISIPNKALAMFDVDTNLKSLLITKNTKIELPVSMTNPSTFVDLMNSNQPTKEILAENIYSRKVQYNGELLDLNTINESMQFSSQDSNKSLAPGEVSYIPSTSHSGISMIVQNKTSRNIPIKEASFSGVRFFQNNVVFPKGITLGMNITNITHAEKGILGTPNYCLGTPMIGIGYDSTTLVYLDENTGDRLSFYISPDNSFVSTILYEFEKYE